MLKSLWKIAVIAVLLALLLVLAPSPLATTDAYADVIDLPLEGKAPAVDWSRYVSDDEYEDPSLHVQVFRGNSFCVTREDGKGNPKDCYTNYVYAVNRIANPTQLRSAFVGRAGNDQTAKGFRIAMDNNAVFAINGDYFCHPWHKETYIVRQGHEYKVRYVDKKWDLLIIDQFGDFHVITEPTRDKLNAWIEENVTNGGLQIINTFNFGPLLIENGETTMEDFNQTLNHDYIGNHKLCQHMCLCQLDKLTYLAVTTEGPDDEKDAGLTMNEFVRCLREIEGKLDGLKIQTAFNLDGGNSATMVFKDPEKNALKKINAPNNRNAERWIKDIIYFASAWQE